MSNPEKTKMDTEKEIRDSSDESDHDYLWSDEEGEIRELVLALPALRVSESPNVDEIIRNEAVVAAQLTVEAAEEAVSKTDQTESGSGDNVGGDSYTYRSHRTRVLMESVAGAPSSSTVIASTEEKEPVKKAKRSHLNHPPEGPPKCNICGRSFISWKAVFGHLRTHKDRGYLGFMPPPTFNAAEEGSGGTVVAASSGGGWSGLGTGGLGIDLNADPVEEEEWSGSGSTPKFDLNMSSPQDEEANKGKEDKAE